MNKLFLILLTILFTGLSAFSQEKKVYADDYFVKVGDMAPDFMINEAGGKSYKLSDLRGNVVMLQFTASWCSVCRTEMPFIEKELWGEKKNSGLKIIGIDRDEPVEKVIQFRKDIAVSYPLALDPGASIFALYAVKTAGVTRNIVIDRAGKIIFLTRLYKREEFDAMKKVIFAELSKK